MGNSTIVNVSGSGKVLGLLAGKATVYATSNDGGFKDSVSVTVIEPEPCVNISYNAVNDFQTLEVDGFVAAYKDNSRNAIAVDASLYPDKFGASQEAFTGVTSYYDITLTTLTESDGESTYRLNIGGKLIGEFQNPKAVKDIDPHTHTFNNVYPLSHHRNP